MARFAGRVSIDLGTGDGRLPYLWARQDPERLFVGVDANAAGLRAFSARAEHERLPNLLYVRAAVEALPQALNGVADRLSVVFPWGSLLAAVARPSPEVLRAMRALCRPGARLAVVLGVDPVRDARELERLGLQSPAIDRLAARLAEGYALAGFAPASVRRASRADLERWPSTWVRRLGPDRQDAIVLVEAEAFPGCEISSRSSAATSDACAIPPDTS